MMRVEEQKGRLKEEWAKNPCGTPEITGSEVEIDSLI